MKRRPLPWATALVAVAALASWRSPGLASSFIYDRTAVAQGQLWRLATSSAVHFSAEHLRWDLLVFVCAGAWVETTAVRGIRTLFVAAPLLIGAVLFTAAPSLVRYGGLSGLNVALVVGGGLIECGQSRRWRWFWRAFLVGIAGKLAWDFRLADSPFVPLAALGIRLAPLSHLAGAAAALMVCGRPSGARASRKVGSAAVTKDQVAVSGAAETLEFMIARADLISARTPASSPKYPSTSAAA